MRKTLRNWLKWRLGWSQLAFAPVSKTSQPISPERMRSLSREFRGALWTGRFTRPKVSRRKLPRAALRGKGTPGPARNS